MSAIAISTKTGNTEKNIPYVPNANTSTKPPARNELKPFFYVKSQDRKNTESSDYMNLSRGYLEEVLKLTKQRHYKLMPRMSGYLELLFLR